jgi:ribosomal protein L37AE/L43A
MDDSNAVPDEHYEQCRDCGDDVDYRRWALGYKFCLDCGNTIAKQRKFTIANSNKQGYELITNLEFLKQLNPKRTT